MNQPCEDLQKFQKVTKVTKVSIHREKDFLFVITFMTHI